MDNRLRKYLEEPEGEEEGLSENQYGFRAGRSTTDAVEAVCRAAEDSGSRYKVKIVMIDIKNAFNSVPWEKIIEAVEEKKVPQRQIFDSYLSKWTIVYQEGEDINIQKEITRGVPQYSVLGPTLWNTLYDGLLKIRIPVRTKFMAFAYDLAIVGTVEDTIQLNGILETTSSRAIRWLQEVGLQLAAQKS